jgi:hypothetical protein
MTRRAVAALGGLLVAGCARAPNAVRIGDRSLPATLLASDDFRDLAHWTAESPTCPPRVDAGSLVWPCGGEGGIGTIWYDQRFTGPLAVTYTVTADNMRNVNFIAYAEHPQGLLETTATRTGAYPEYQVFPNYITTLLTNGEPRWRVRFRRDPGFALMSETYADMDTTASVPHRVAHVFDGAGHLSLYVDGRLLHSAVDTAGAYRTGYLGLRTWRTNLRYGEFRVYQLGEAAR